MKICLSACSLLIMGVFGLVPSIVQGGIRYENFGVDPNWSSTGNGVNSNNFGYQVSNFAGGTSGEAGGRFTRTSVTRYYGDTDLLGQFTLDDSFSADGKFDFTLRNNPDFGNGLRIGYFSTVSEASVGIVLNNNGTNDLYWFAAVFFPDGSSVTSNTATLIDPYVDRDWSLSWDPNGGVSGHGLLAISLSGVGFQTVQLNALQRAQTFDVDAFGLYSPPTPTSSGNQNVPTWFADVFVDDVQYKVVPEPSTMLFGAIPLSALLLRQRRRVAK